MYDVGRYVVMGVYICSICDTIGYVACCVCICILCGVCGIGGMCGIWCMVCVSACNCAHIRCVVISFKLKHSIVEESC